MTFPESMKKYYSMHTSRSRFYLGIDPSLTSTGLVIIGQDRLHIHRIQPRKLRGVERLAYIEDDVIGGVHALGGSWFAAIEGPSLHSTNRADDLGQLRGVLLMFLHRKKIPTLIVPPTTLKKYGTTRGNASKTKMIEAAERDANRKMQSDEADAYWLAHLCWAYHGTTYERPTVLTRAQVEVLSGIRKTEAS